MKSGIEFYRVERIRNVHSVLQILNNKRIIEAFLIGVSNDERHEVNELGNKESEENVDLWYSIFYAFSASVELGGGGAQWSYG